MFTMILTRATCRKVGGFMAYLLLVGFAGALISHSAIAASQYRMLAEEALSIGEEFGVVVGEVDEETREILGLQRAEGVVVYEVIGGRPADLAGIKVKAIIKEIDKVEIRTLEDFGRALKTALQTDNFTVATYEPADPENQGLTGGINFHFVRVEKQ